MYSVFKIFNPEVFQGKNKRKNYFEGWYFKFVDATEHKTFSLIPGVSFGEKKGEAHAFIQLIDVADYKTIYFKYDISEFKYSKNSFNIVIGKSTFSSDSVCLNLKNEEFEINGKFSFSEIIPFPKTLFKPGIMGPFTFITFMECYHGIINIQHKIQGELSINGEKTNFTNGIGYVEKDWGKSFPESWVWIQSNHFEHKDTCLMFSFAKIPWLNTHFLGFVVFLNVQNKLYLYTTYSGAKILHYEHKNKHVHIIVGDKKTKMNIEANCNETGVLKAPQNGVMHREILESISSIVEITLTDKNNCILFHELGRNVGMEIVGEFTNRTINN